MTELLNLIPLLIFNCLWCVGFYTVTYFEYEYVHDKFLFHERLISESDENKMILWRIRYYSLKWFGEWYSKPICTCLTCMGSLHSLWFWAFNSFSLHNAMIYVLYAFALAGLNRLIVSKFEI